MTDRELRELHRGAYEQRKKVLSNDPSPPPAKEHNTRYAVYDRGRQSLVPDEDGQTTFTTKHSAHLLLESLTGGEDTHPTLTVVKIEGVDL